MKKLAFILFFLALKPIDAQVNYNFSLGLRAGETSGLSLKKTLINSTAIEGLIGFSRHGLSATVLLEKYETTDLSQLNWYYGSGAHLTFENKLFPAYNLRNDRYFENGGVGVGIDGLFGLEYQVEDTPVAVNLELKPFIEINTRGTMWASFDPALGIKLVF